MFQNSKGVCVCVCVLFSEGAEAPQAAAAQTQRAGKMILDFNF